MKTKLILSLIIILSLGYCLTLILGVPLFQSIFGWFWYLHFTELKSWIILLPMPLVIIYLARRILAGKDKQTTNVVLLLVFGFLLQLTIAFSEGNGIYALRDRLVYCGHSEFAQLAAKDLSIADVATNYEELASKGDLWQYPRSKPPGTLLFFMAIERVVNLFCDSGSYWQRYINLITASVYILPVLSCLVLLPLFRLGRYLSNPEVAAFACLFYILTPSFNLQTLNLDQSLYPMIFTSTLLLFLLACRRKSFVLFLVSGLLICASLYFTFSLLPVVFACFCIFIYEVICNEKASITELLKYIAGTLAGFLGLSFVLYFTLNYNIIIRYEHAMAFHVYWKDWQSTPSQIVRYGLINFLEYAVWTGFPVILLLIAGTISHLKKHGFRLVKLSPQYLIVALGLIFVILSIFGQTRAETARLWIFLMPLTCLLSAFLFKNEMNKDSKIFLYLLTITELCVTLSIKIFQDVVLENIF